MIIEVWSDYACPFCYIGKRRLEEALEQFAHSDKVEVEFKSFELDPNAPLDSGQSNYERLAAKYGMSVEQAKGMSDNMAEQAKEVGLTFNFDTLIPTNTFDAHRLTHFAKAEGKEEAFTEKLFHAYFTDSKHLGQHAVLADIAAEAGLDREKVQAVLEDETAFETDVRSDQQMAQQIGVQGVPFFVFNRKYAVSGAQPTEVFVETLQKVWDEEQGE